MTFITHFIENTDINLYYSKYPHFSNFLRKLVLDYKRRKLLEFVDIASTMGDYNYMPNDKLIVTKLDVKTQSYYELFKYNYDLSCIMTPDIFLNISLSKDIKLSKVIKYVKIYPGLRSPYDSMESAEWYALQSHFTSLYLEQLINVNSNHSNLLLPLISVMNCTLLPIGKERRHITGNNYMGVRIELQENIPDDLKFSFNLIFSSNYKRYNDLISSKCLKELDNSSYYISEVCYFKPVCKHNYFNEKCDCEYPRPECIYNRIEQHLIKQLYVCFEDNYTPDYFKVTVYNINVYDNVLEALKKHIRFYEKYKDNELKENYTFIIKTDKRNKLQELINHDDFLDFLLTHYQCYKNIKIEPIMNNKENVKYHLFEERINEVGISADPHHEIFIEAYSGF